MRYSSAFVLSTLAIGQAAAANLHNRHASFHERRRVESKREVDVSGVDWSKVAYDLKDVDWNAVFDKPAHDAAAAPASSPSTPKPQPSVAVAAAAAAVPSVKAQALEGATVVDAVSGIAALTSHLSPVPMMGANSKTNNGGIWLGTDSPWQATVVNSASQDVVFYCWKAAGYSGPFVGANQPDVSVHIPPGGKISLSFADSVGVACAPVFPDTVMAPGVGYIYNTWFEATFKAGVGAFDVSREPFMNGRSISAKGSRCTSDMSTCVFKCIDPSVAHCEKGYTLVNCGASNGGGSGYDPVMQGAAGGCNAGASSENVQITLS